MPNGKTHKSAGAIMAATLFFIIYDNLDLNDDTKLRDFLLTMLTGYGTSRLPDILEPADNPNHRQFFHSFTFGLVMVFLGVKVWERLKESRRQRSFSGEKIISTEELIDFLILFLIGAYLLHLLMDGQTKKGLPFI